MDSATKGLAVTQTGLSLIANTTPSKPTTLQKTLRFLAVGLWMWLIWIFGSKDFSASETFSIIRSIINFFFPGWPDANLEMMRFLHITSRKIAHFLEYGILSLLWHRALLGKSRTLLSIAFSVFWACVDEYHQSFIPNRTASIEDVGIDSLGIIAAQIMIIKYTLKRKLKC